MFMSMRILVTLLYENIPDLEFFCLIRNRAIEKTYKHNEINVEIDRAQEYDYRIIKEKNSRSEQKKV